MDCCKVIIEYHKQYISRRDLYSFKEIANGFPKSCQEVHQSGGQDGYYNLDPVQHNLDPISVFCNMSSTLVTAVLHHNLENWTYVHGYLDPWSYNGQVGSATTVEHTHHAKRNSNQNQFQ